MILNLLSRTSDCVPVSQVGSLIPSLHCDGGVDIGWALELLVLGELQTCPSQAVWGLLTFRDVLSLGNKAMPLKSETSSQREPEAHLSIVDKRSTNL